MKHIIERPIKGKGRVYQAFVPTSFASNLMIVIKRMCSDCTCRSVALRRIMIKGQKPELKYPLISKSNAKEVINGVSRVKYKESRNMLCQVLATTAIFSSLYQQILQASVPLLLRCVTPNNKCIQEVERPPYLLFSSR